MQVGDRITIWSKTGEPIEGVVIKVPRFGYLVSWNKRVVPLQRLYPSGGDEWAMKERHREHVRNYRKAQRRKLREAVQGVI
jgi:hypothetical protein